MYLDLTVLLVHLIKNLISKDQAESFWELYASILNAYLGIVKHVVIFSQFPLSNIWCRHDEIEMYSLYRGIRLETS